MSTVVTGRRRWSLAARLYAWQLGGIVVIVGLALVALGLDSRDREEADAAERALAITTSIAGNPFVVESLEATDPTALLQPYAAALLNGTGLDFITIMLPDRTRLTHPDDAQIGRPFLGTIAPALEGRTFTETFAGTLGPSVRAVAPIMDPSGRVVALASAGITLTSVGEAIDAQLPRAIGIALLAAGIASIGSWLLSRSLRRATWGRGPEQMREMFSYYESVLHSVREGLVLVDRSGNLVLYNDQAAEFLGLGKLRTDAQSRPVSSLDIAPSLREVLAGGETVVDEIHLTASHVLVVNQEPALPSGRFAPHVAVGTVTTLRDHTELQRLTGELDSTRLLSEALRAQTHEFANRLHTIVSLIELGRTDEATLLATDQLAIGQRLADEVMGAVSEPVLAALLLGKSAQAAERGIRLYIDCDRHLDASGIAGVDLVTILGNLVDNAFDAAFDATFDATRGVADDRAADVARPGAFCTDPPWVEVYLATIDGAGTPGRTLVLQVSDSGPGLAPGDLANATRRGVTTKETDAFGRGLGLALVLRAVRRCGGTITSTARGGSSVTVEVPVPSPGVTA
ncbi:MAG: sensor histidine kinase [Burkholderiaceae bacterium]|nr:sensor histidine kinase [Microbacteriaceae bacterium]